MVTLIRNRDLSSAVATLTRLLASKLSQKWRIADSTAIVPTTRFAAFKAAQQTLARRVDLAPYLEFGRKIWFYIRQGSDTVFTPIQNLYNQYVALGYVDNILQALAKLQNINFS